MSFSLIEPLRFITSSSRFYEKMGFNSLYKNTISIIVSIKRLNFRSIDVFQTRKMKTKIPHQKLRFMALDVSSGWEQHETGSWTGANRKDAVNRCTLMVFYNLTQSTPYLDSYINNDLISKCKIAVFNLPNQQLNFSSNQ